MKALDSAIESLDQTIRGYDQENCMDIENHIQSGNLRE